MRHGERRDALTPAGEDVLRAVAPVVLGSLFPADREAGERALDDAMRTVDDYLAHLSLPLQGQARGLLAVLNSLPARAALLGTTRSWRHARPERVEIFLRRARRSPIQLLRRTYDFLHSMTVIGFFDLPIAWSAVDYPGPAMERPIPAERVS